VGQGLAGCQGLRRALVIAQRAPEASAPAYSVARRARSPGVAVAHWARPGSCRRSKASVAAIHQHLGPGLHQRMRHGGFQRRRPAGLASRATAHR
jgi:hypothetical protein